MAPELIRGPEVLPPPAVRRPRGRPDKLTPTVQAEVVKYLLAGVALGPACRLAGIHPQTGYKWEAWGVPYSHSAAANLSTRMHYRNIAGRSGIGRRSLTSLKLSRTRAHRTRPRGWPA